MKTDTTTLVLNLVLAVLVVSGVVCAVLAMNRARDLRGLTTNATAANNALMRAQSLANDAAAYNVQAKDPALTRILTVIQAKPAR